MENHVTRMTKAEAVKLTLSRLRLAHNQNSAATAVNLETRRKNKEAPFAGCCAHMIYREYHPHRAAYSINGALSIERSKQ